MTAPGVANNEKPLLLDPCADEPAEHLEFDEMGLVHGKTKRGETSIHVFALIRPELCSAREQHAKDVLALIEDVLEDQEFALERPDEPKMQARLQRKLKRLSELCEEKSQFAGLTRQLVRAELGLAELAVVPDPPPTVSPLVEGRLP